MTRLVAVYATGMLITGALNTLTVKYQDKAVVGHTWNGEPITFYHPAVQSAFMFFGEFLCLVPFLLQHWHRRSKQPPPRPPSPPTPRPPLYPQYPLQEPLLGPTPHSKPSDGSRVVFVLALPTLCDATSTVLMNVGLYYTSASAFQMLRGTVIFFAALFTMAILKRRLQLHHWQGMLLIIMGAFAVGVSSVLTESCPSDHAHHHRHPNRPGGHDEYDYDLSDRSSDAFSLYDGHQLDDAMANTPIDAVAAVAAALGASSDGDSSGGECRSANVLLGNAFVMAAQVFSALQFVIEEKYVKQYHMPALLAVGLEGTWGLILSCAVLPLCLHLRDPDGWPIDDAKAGLTAVAASSPLLAAVVGSILSMALFNFFGVSVTKKLSSTARLSIDASRTAVVWVFSLIAGWEHFVGFELLGFLIIICGTVLYNEVLLVSDPATAAAQGSQPPQSGPSLWQAPAPATPQGRDSISSAGYDMAPSLHIAAGVLDPGHAASPQSLGGLSTAAPQLWDTPSMDSGVMRHADIGSSPQASFDLRSGESLYSRWYSGRDAGTPPLSARRGAPRQGHGISPAGRDGDATASFGTSQPSSARLGAARPSPLSQPSIFQSIAPAADFGNPAGDAMLQASAAAEQPRLRPQRGILAAQLQGNTPAAEGSSSRERPIRPCASAPSLPVPRQKSTSTLMQTPENAPLSDASASDVDIFAMTDGGDISGAGGMGGPPLQGNQ